MQLKHHKKYLEKFDKLKKCSYKGCDVTFYGRGVTKYCPEHRKQEYKSKLYHDVDTIISLNQIIEHKTVLCPTKTCKCGLEGCYNTFEIKLLPRVTIYPKFCEEHRNEYKRNLFIKSIS
jgi:hypothetical protein